MAFNNSKPPSMSFAGQPDPHQTDPLQGSLDAQKTNQKSYKSPSEYDAVQPSMSGDRPQNGKKQREGTFGGMNEADTVTNQYTRDPAKSQHPQYLPDSQPSSSRHTSASAPQESGSPIAAPRKRRSGLIYRPRNKPRKPQHRFCSTCGKRLCDQKGLLRHWRSIHSGLRPYKCDVPGCTSDFTRLDRLRKHVRDMHQKPGKHSRRRSLKAGPARQHKLKILENSGASQAGHTNSVHGDSYIATSSTDGRRPVGTSFRSPSYVRDKARRHGTDVVRGPASQLAAPLVNPMMDPGVGEIQYRVKMSYTFEKTAAGHVAAGSLDGVLEEFLGWPEESQEDEDEDEDLDDFKGWD